MLSRRALRQQLAIGKERAKHRRIGLLTCPASRTAAGLGLIGLKKSPLPRYGERLPG
jgi:hypothetical protein